VSQDAISSDWFRINPRLPSRLHHRLALNRPGRGDGEGGRENPPVEPELSPITALVPTDSAEDPFFSGCLPCRQDYPSVKLVHDLYKDKGLVVIGIHANRYESLDAVREYVSEKKMSFPVVVDFPDGRSIARYQKHGIALGYPSYVLLDPEGKVLLDDTTIPHPYLRGYKLEIIRNYIIGNSGKQP
jgi:AhpC/TSA family